MPGGNTSFRKVSKYRLCLYFYTFGVKFRLLLFDQFTLVLSRHLFVSVPFAITVWFVAFQVEDDDYHLDDQQTLDNNDDDDGAVTHDTTPGDATDDSTIDTHI